MAKDKLSKYYVIDSDDDLDRLIQACKKTRVIAYDFETTGLKKFNKDFKATLLSITFQAGSSIIIPLLHHERTPKQQKQGLKWLEKFGREVLENPLITKYAWNMKYDNQVLRLYNIYIRGTLIDGMLAKYTLDESKPNDLKSMVVRYLPKKAGYQKESNFDKWPWDKKPWNLLTAYASTDTDCTFQLCTFFEKRLIEEGFYPLFRNLIMAASRVLTNVEYHGLPIDWDFNKSLEVKYSKLIEDLNNEIRTLPAIVKFQKRYNKHRVTEYISKLELTLEDLRNEKIIMKRATKPDLNEINKIDKKIKSIETRISNVLTGVYTNKTERELLRLVNFGSTQEMVKLLYEAKYGLKLPILKYTKNKNKKNHGSKNVKKNPSTDEEVLQKLIKEGHDESGFITKLLKLRDYEHNMSTFILGYQSFRQDDNKMHGSFHIHGTVTGRLSSSEPNLQQIPKKEVNPDIKKQYITPKGMLFFSYDYSQAELRMMAHLSGDETLLEAFRTGKDPHLLIACKKYGFDYDKIYPIYKDETHKDYKIWKVRRKQAKQIVFGTIYGIEALKLSQQLSDPKNNIIVTEAEAQKFLDEFFADYPKIRKFIEKQGRYMEKHGYVFSVFGRKRRCPTIYSDKPWEYSEAKRQAVNAPCQSAGSDMALFASILLDRKMRKGQLPRIPEVSTVHDALYHFAYPEYLNPYTVHNFHKICKNPNTKKYFGFSIDDVSMEVDFKVGRTLEEELPYIPGYDYSKLLSPDFSPDEYLKLANETNDINPEDYPKHYPQYFTKEFQKSFKKQYTKIFNTR